MCAVTIIGQTRKGSPGDLTKMEGEFGWIAPLESPERSVEEETKVKSLVLGQKNFSSPQPLPDQLNDSRHTSCRLDFNRLHYIIVWEEFEDPHTSVVPTRVGEFLCIFTLTSSFSHSLTGPGGWRRPRRSFFYDLHLHLTSNLPPPPTSIRVKEEVRVPVCNDTLTR